MSLSVAVSDLQNPALAPTSSLRSALVGKKYRPQKEDLHFECVLGDIMRSHYPCRDSTVDGPNASIFFITILFRLSRLPAFIQLRQVAHASYFSPVFPSNNEEQFYLPHTFGSLWRSLDPLSAFRQAEEHGCPCCGAGFNIEMVRAGRWAI